MLDFFRRGVKSIFARILLGLLIASFAVWGIGDIFTGGRASPVVYVGETEVGAERFAEAIQRQQSAISQRAGELVGFADLRAAGIDQRVIAGLVREAAYAEELAQRGIAVPAEAVRDTIASNPSFQDGTGAFSQFAYQNIISQQGYRPRDFETLTARLLGEQILTDAVTTGVTAPRAVAEAIAAFDGETRSIRYVALPAADAPDPGAPDDSTLTAWFDDNKETFREPERRWGNFIHIDPRLLAEKLAPAEADVRAAYDENLDRYTQEATRTVEQIVFPDLATATAAAARLADGTATFEEIAAEQNVPLDDLSLGVVRKDDLAEDSAAAVFAMTAPGIAGPVDGLFGAALLNVTDLQAGGVQPFEDVKAGISLLMSLDLARTAVAQKVNQLDDIRASGADLPELAEEVQVPLVPLDGLSRSGTVKGGDLPGAVADPRFIGEVFAASEGEERDIVELADGSYVLVMVDKVVESHMPDLAEIRDAVVAGWALDARLSAQEASAEGFSGNAVTTLDAVAADLGQQIFDVPAFARSSPPPNFAPELIETIFTADAGSKLVGRSRDGTSALLIEVAEISGLDDAQMAVQADELEALLSGAVARDQLEYFARALELRHGARVDNASVDAIFEQLSQTGYGGL